ncbi:hypothetical protein KAU09_05600 [Candidatus Parcubacteria bacterium]|nr:hypothetical protein [Candidatus Parcubacteria bacterium]
MKIKLLTSLFLLIFFTIGCSENITIEQSVTSPNIRAEIKTYIDNLYGLEIISTAHTTDGKKEKSEKFLPEEPKQFTAGRYKIIFGSGNNKKTLIAQTEEKVGHISPITPGITDIGGYIQIVKNDNENNSGINHTTWGNGATKIINEKLNTDELDYFIRMLYKKFNNNMVYGQTKKINKVKDYALAIKFSGKPGIKDYHNGLKKLIK